MNREQIERVDVGVPDIVAERADILRELFPEAVSEGKVDFEKFRLALGDEVEGKAERYSFSWAGKRDCIRLLQMPSRATLVPTPEESINFKDTGNIFIEGDNLEVLKLLYRSYFGRVKLIYIDPPYNTGNDFVYPDNYADPLDTYLKLTGQKDENGNLLTSNVETGGRFHSSWLSMMYPRLFLSRQLLSEDGVMLISIDDKEVHNLRLILDEIFGSEAFIAQFVWKSRQFPDARAVTNVSTDHEYILAYARAGYAGFRGIERDESKFSNPDNDPRGLWMSRSLLGLATAEQRPNLHYDIVDPKTGIAYPPVPEKGWRYSRETMNRLIEENRILFPSKPEGRPREKKFRADLLAEFRSFPSIINDVYTSHGTQEIRELFGTQVFDFPKPSALIRRFVEQATSSDDVILDYFAGSCPTAHAVFDSNREDSGDRKFICIQLPEPLETPKTAADGMAFTNIAEIGKERIRRVVAKLSKREEDKLDLGDRGIPEDLGFRVFKLNESNFKPWVGVEDNEPESYAKQMDMFIDPLLEGWKPEQVIWEVAVKEGYGLSSRIERIPEIETNAIYRVTDPDKEQSFFICLDDELKPETAKSLGLTKDALFICRDTALSDELAANLALQCHLKTI